MTEQQGGSIPHTRRATDSDFAHELSVEGRLATVENQVNTQSGEQARMRDTLHRQGNILQEQVFQSDRVKQALPQIERIASMADDLERIAKAFQGVKGVLWVLAGVGTLIGGLVAILSWLGWHPKL